MDTVRANHITYNGPGLWHILHRMAYNANNPHNKSLFQEFLLVFQQALTCQVCLLEFTTFLQQHPLDEYDNILYENSTVNVDVDGVKYIVENVYSLKNKINNEPIVITPGKHLVKVMLNDSIIVQENIFIGLQETKKIILR